MYDTRESLESLVGKRIRLTRMAEIGKPDPCPIPDGATGEVRNVAGPFAATSATGKSAQVMVKWDPPNEKRTLSIVTPYDTFEVIS